MDYFNYFTHNIVKIEILVGALTFIVNGFLGILIFSRNPRSWTNRFFFMLVIVLNAYIVVNYLSLHPSRPGDQFFWIKVVMFTSAFMGPLLFMLAHTFPGDKISLQRPYLIGLAVITLLTAGFSLAGYVFKALVYTNGRPLPVPGLAMPLFFLSFVGLIFLSFVVLILRYRRLKDNDKERAQEKYFLLGIVSSFTLITLVTIISVVILKNSNLVVLGPIFSVVMIAPIAYAIVRYQLFNIKIIATNLLVIIVWIILGSKLLVSDSTVGFIVDAIILFLMIVFGILLVKSVKREVEQREKLEILTKELGLANKKLKELDHLKSQFLSFASHQIKTPLAAIKGFASLICDGSYGECPPRVSETSHKIEEAANRMISLVNKFLDLRKIEEGKMEYTFEKLDGVKMVNNVVEELKPLAQAKSLDLTFESEINSGWINADAQRLRQVFQNLIENAVKYTDPPSHEASEGRSSGFVKVNIKSADGYLVFSVSDSGHGMEKDLLSNLFEEFKRAGTSDTKRIEGTGLGLFIAKQMVTGHKGEIWAESDGPGKGSKFIVKIPLAG